MAIRAGKLDPSGARRVKHTRVGVWDLYEELQADSSSSLRRKVSLSRSKAYVRIVQGLPHVARMLKDILSIRRARMLLPAFLVVEVLDSLIPAISLWYSGQLLHLALETAIDSHIIDTTGLIHATVGRVACTIARHLLRYARSRIIIPLKMCIKQFYDRHTFYSIARLDLPTFEDSAIQNQLMHASDASVVAWGTVQALTDHAVMTISLLSQLSVLFSVLRKQQDGPLLVILGFSQTMFQWYQTRPKPFSSLQVWAATTTDKDYIRMRGLKNLCDGPSHRKELVAGNLGEYITAQFRESAQRVGDDAGEFHELYEVHTINEEYLSIALILRKTLHLLPQVLGIDVGVDEVNEMNQIVFALRAVQNSRITPLSLASLVLIEHISDSFFLVYLSQHGPNLATMFTLVRELYEFENVRNKVVDGTEPFPKTQQPLRNGISIEFRNVSFQYPGKEKPALQNVSFKIGAGQLCVIVGVNGSGKSTILKLISRIYDPAEGTILINNHDIKTLRLAELRAAMSILFQDYTHFPLSISENIGLGNLALVHDDDKVREAARLGGAEDFIDELPDGFDTYIHRPVQDRYAGLPLELEPPEGWPVDYSLVRSVGGLRASAALGLSGGQNQRLAVSRTFMRSLVTETDSSAGMLLFDEPSASLDPTAEHDLFERLRMLRGNKTMIFSTHRFGNLTRHADLILYIHGSVQEEGTHDELIQKGGDYARNWNLQAKPFL